MKKIKKFLKITLVLILVLASGTTFAQTDGEVYSDGNVRIIPQPNGWQVMHFSNVVAHGDGVLDLKNLPPAFKDFLAYYATLPQAQSPRHSLSKSASATYGPLLTTQWNQYTPYNDLFPTMMAPNSAGETIEQRTITGCVQISTAQILNYYGYCNTINQSGAIYNKANFTSMSDVFGLTKGKNSDGNYKYSYNIANYTPDFAKIRSDNYEIAKFIYAISLVQGAIYDVEGTGTSDWDQEQAFTNIYGYKIITSTNISNLISDSYIENSIKDGCPVIICGDDNDGGHSYIIDGYNGNGEFHINYGWGGDGDGWFLNTQYYNNMHILIVRPYIDDFAVMQSAPQYVHIKGNGIDQDYELLPQGGLQYETDIELPAGSYDYYYVYADGSKLAPYGCGTISFSKKDNTFAHHGTFSSTPATFVISNAQTISFAHNAGKNEISLEAEDIEVNISGRVVDQDGNPFQGAYVSFAKTSPQTSIEKKSEPFFSISTHCSFYFNNTYYTTEAIQLQKKYITAIEFQTKTFGEPSDLTVAILDKYGDAIWQKTYSRNEIGNGSWTKVELENVLEIQTGEDYYLGLRNPDSDNNNYYVFYTDSNGNMYYRIWTSNDRYTTTDDNGNYTINVERGSSGKLFAHQDDWLFEPIEYKNISQDITKQNFNGLSKTVTISGKVMDNGGNALHSTYVSFAETTPQPYIEKRSESTKNIYSSDNFNTYYTTEAIQLQKKYITAIEFRTKTRNVQPNNLKVAILDKDHNTIWHKTCSRTEVEDGSWTKIELEKVIEILPNEDYYLGLLETGESPNCYYLFYGDNNDNMQYRIWTSNDRYTTTDKNGHYAINVERGSSGKLYAHDGDCLFEPLEYKDIQQDIKNQDFIGISKNVTITGKVMDEDGNPLKGVYVSCTGTTLQTSIEKKSESGGTLTFSHNYNDRYYTTEAFQLQKKYITAIEFRTYVLGTPNDLTVAILDKEQHAIWQKTYSHNEINSGRKVIYWTKAELENELEIQPGEDYYLGLWNTGSDINNCYNFYHDGNANMLYRIWTTNDHYTTTDNNGKYSINVERYSSGKLFAHDGDWIFEPLEYKDIHQDITNQNFNGISKKLAITGKVMDMYGNAIQGAYISFAEAIPQISIEKNSESGIAGYTSDSFNGRYFTTESFQLQKKYITAIEFHAYAHGNPNDLIVAILDKERNAIWQKTYSKTELETINWIKTELENELEILPDEDYYLGLWTTGSDNDNHYFYFLDPNDKMAYRIWTSNDLYTTTDNNGNYSINVERGSSGNLYAHKVKNIFVPLQWDNIQNPLTNQNFNGVSDKVTISGKVFDEHGLPLAGVHISATEPNPIVSVSQEANPDEYEGTFGCNVWFMNPSSSCSGNFVADKECLSSIDLRILKHGNPDGLIVSIIDYNKDTLCKKIIHPSSHYIGDGGWTNVDIPENIKMEIGQEYTIFIKPLGFCDDSNYHFLTTGISPTRTEPFAYRLWTSDNYFTISDNNGNYSINVDRYSSGKLFAQDGNCNFESLEYKDTNQDITNQDFYGISKNVAITGKVMDMYGNAIQGAYVSFAETTPQPSSIEKKSESDGNYNMVNDTYYTTEYFQLQKKYITAIEFHAYAPGEPNYLTVAILDKDCNVIWQKTLSRNEIVMGNRTKVELENALEILPGEDYCVRLWNTGSDNDSYYFFSSDRNNNVAYRIWTSNDRYATTDNNGNYTINVERGSSGKMFAHYGDKEFKAMKYNNITEILSDIDFIEGGFIALPISIQIATLPSKLTYIEGDEIELNGGLITVSYNNNTSQTVAITDAIICGFDDTKIGAQTLTVEYSGLQTTFEVTVEAKPDENPETATENITANNIKIWSYDKTIVVENGGKEISIVDMSGRTIKTVKADNQRTEITMQKSGIFIVKAGIKTQKVIIH